MQRIPAKYSGGIETWWQERKPPNNWFNLDCVSRSAPSAAEAPDSTPTVPPPISRKDRGEAAANYVLVRRVVHFASSVPAV